MKIDGPDSRASKTNRTKRADKKSAVSGSRTASRSGSTSAAASSKSTSGENVSVSDHQETLALIKKLVSDSPDIRMGEVDRIASQIKSGKYKINFEKVAEGFIKEAILQEVSKKAKWVSNDK